MIPLGDVPFLMDTGRLVLPAYSRATARGIRRAARRIRRREACRMTRPACSPLQPRNFSPRRPDDR